jgi:hypothetical protein
MNDAVNGGISHRTTHPNNGTAGSRGAPERQLGGRAGVAGAYCVPTVRCTVVALAFGFAWFLREVPLRERAT